MKYVSNESERSFPQRCVLSSTTLHSRSIPLTRELLGIFGSRSNSPIRTWYTCYTRLGLRLEILHLRFLNVNREILKMWGGGSLRRRRGWFKSFLLFLQKYISRRESEIVFPEEVWRLVSYMEQGWKYML